MQQELKRLAQVDVSRIQAGAWSALSALSTWNHLTAKDDIDDITPIMCIRDGKVTFRNTGRHPAAYRCPGVAVFVEQCVLPLVSLDVSGEYRFETHDASEGARVPTLCFARDMSIENAYEILVPDFYQMFGYRGQFDDVNDPIDWSSKLPKAVFAGTTTGPVDPAKNKRVEACRWALGRTDCDFKITSVCQMTPDALVAHCGQHANISGPYLTTAEHFKYRYVLNIVGNTCCWSRVPMILKSGSLMLNLSHDQGTFYYPLLKDGEHYIGISNIAEIGNVIVSCESNVENCKRIVRNGNDFVAKYCTQHAAAVYMAHVLDAIAAAKSNITKKPNASSSILIKRQIL